MILTHLAFFFLGTGGTPPTPTPEPGIPAHIGQSFDPASLYREAEEIVRRHIDRFERKIRRAKTRAQVEQVITDQIPALRLPESFIPSYSSELLETLQAYMSHQVGKQDVLAALAAARDDEDEEIAVVMMLWN